jgi:hypothetical protein
VPAYEHDRPLHLLQRNQLGFDHGRWSALRQGQLLEASTPAPAERTEASPARMTDPIDAPDGEFTALGAYYDGFCGIRTDGTTSCWLPTPANAMVPPRVGSEHRRNTDRAPGPRWSIVHRFRNFLGAAENRTAGF